MQQYRLKHIFDVFGPVTKENFTEAQAICSHVVDPFFPIQLIYLGESEMNSINCWGEYLIKKEDGRWHFIKRECLESYEIISTISEPDRIIAHLSTTANTEEGYWEVQYKNLWSLYQPLRDKAEEANREQQIAFAEWMGRKRIFQLFSGKWYRGLSGRYSGEFIAEDFEALRELFLTETKQQ